ncbi:MAG TPA: M3 family oligoendopeptidase [Bacilli bacterium]
MDTERKQTWNLATIFSGGSDSAEFRQFLTQLAADIDSLRAQTADLQKDALPAAIAAVQSVSARLTEADSFVACLEAQDVKDKKATALSGTVKELHAAYISAMTGFDKCLTGIGDAEWAKLMQTPDLRQLAFVLNERRTLALAKMPSELESLAADLAVDGYHGWSELYDTVVGSMQIPFEQDGASKMLSVGQAHNLLHSANRKERERMFAAWTKAWQDAADFCGDALNHLAGFRLQLYKHRGWDEVLKEPLLINRMSPKTLAAMWRTIEKNKAACVQFLQRKAEIFGIPALNWYDVDAPVFSVQESVTFDEAAELIITQFGKFSPRMAEFAKMAFAERWIEAEDRPGKRPGGFCTSFPLKRQSRIFMTFAGTKDNVATLAHELGHAFHQHVMDDLPDMLQQYAMNVAETASTFAELIVSDAAVNMAADRGEKLALLAEKAGNVVTFFMNIHCRFLFETRFYEERKRGRVSVERLHELMEEAQKEAFCGVLGEYHPQFWASKLHFYITSYPFYNFPYTFGYLFSAGIYARALQEGSSFEQRYVNLLRDTGAMTVEQLAQKHLQADLTGEAFWQSAVDVVQKDIAEFLRLTEAENTPSQD